MRLEDLGVVPEMLNSAPETGFYPDGDFEPRPDDGFYSALDGHIVRAGGRSWRVILFSVRVDDGQCWVQLALRGPQDYALTMCLRSGEGARHVVGLIRAWLVDSSSVPQIRNVASLSDHIDDAAPSKRRSIVRFRNNGAAHPASVAGSAFPHQGHIHRHVR